MAEMAEDLVEDQGIGGFPHQRFVGWEVAHAVTLRFPMPCWSCFRLGPKPQGARSCPFAL